MGHKIVTFATNEELRRLKFIFRITAEDIRELLDSERGGPSLSTVNSWLGKPSSVNYNQMPANSLDLLIIRLDEAGYTEA